jgi:hypothetical protein
MRDRAGTSPRDVEKHHTDNMNVKVRNPKRRHRVHEHQVQLSLERGPLAETSVLGPPIPARPTISCWEPVREVEHRYEKINLF